MYILYVAVHGARCQNRLRCRSGESMGVERVTGTRLVAGLRGEGGFTAELGQHASITLEYRLES
ncbi:MAG: hypothetical protein M3069_00425 [Chloroflexota bacterium]|nr:hypothetical protein [Chloroflexota bacterium]